MIQPRHTGPNRATLIGDFNPLHTLNVEPRPTAHCRRCNARLSTYRPPQTSLCWPCEAANLAARTPVDLHPPERHQRLCPGCGQPMFRTSSQCRGCAKRAPA